MTPRGEQPEQDDDRVVKAARQAADRVKAERSNPEPSLSSRLAQIGVLGWAIVVPILLALLAGRWLDRFFSTGIMFSAALIIGGAVFGMWSAWKWMGGHD
ncbi:MULTISPECIES: AtpZ/AtpI family protein [Alphaproteobacteria]|uniref:ATP synthase protein I n=2 Tax=Alphaproteobacteria TaxID=28211 RepID=A0A512HKZ5_9HYPH|nr:MULTISPECIES: AtpZ/AtpI family protein [Alphaproteobacteria]GEO86127.1 hypothetical protein RNA01_30590 [Ciceribacter naphthalenivorans]GLR22694.1 hypothetical protein GCM10007920_24820 [Ciceribacter naphthalenivorans]GLT05550.1 hypothetical protein GCM10007926_24820 [Sphingomonas psychrolutea]